MSGTDRNATKVAPAELVNQVRDTADTLRDLAEAVEALEGQLEGCKNVLALIAEHPEEAGKAPVRAKWCLELLSGGPISVTQGVL